MFSFSLCFIIIFFIFCSTLIKYTLHVLFNIQIRRTSFFFSTQFNIIFHFLRLETKVEKETVGFEFFLTDQFFFSTVSNSYCGVTSYWILGYLCGKRYSKIKYKIIILIVKLLSKI